MNESSKTSYYTAQPRRPVSSANLTVTVFDGTQEPWTVALDSFRKPVVTFGRHLQNTDPSFDINLRSKLVSNRYGEHGRFRLTNGQWIVEENKSTNGLIYNHTLIKSKVLSDGDFIRIDDGVEAVPEGVLFVFTDTGFGNRWNTIPLAQKTEITIGRDSGCDITLSHISVSKFHAKITRGRDGYYIVDNGSMNGVMVNNRRISGQRLLHEKDVIGITNSKLIFTSNSISYCCYHSGISVDANKVVITRGKGRKRFITGNNISLGIRPGELVAVIGGSGAGKSTILNCMCGYLPPASGAVYINGVNLYQNFESLKKLIGYVPQSDIVYDNLTLYDMLSYTAKLRLPKDTTSSEREEAINRAIALVELTEKKDSYIKQLSGGQKKRASIAVELLSDPNLLFLDEPTSGLDPGTERNLMESLREMANNGKTIILVTHSTLQLQMCDKIVFMGKGGNLCFFGSLNEALDFFGVDDVVDVYNMITDEAIEWHKTFDRFRAGKMGEDRGTPDSLPNTKRKRSSQLGVLCTRYVKLILNDRQRLLILFLMGPLLTLFISLVANGEQFEQYEITKSLLFALSCCAFWVGMFNAIQEICKERTIIKREYMTGLSMTSYILSKLLVLAVLCLLQSVLIVSIFALAVGLPEEGVILSPYLELLITTFLTAVSAAAMGLLVSAIVDNPDRATTFAPILLMPQIVFSGIIFSLDGATEIISWFATCRWCMEGYGTTADLNSLTLRLVQEGFSMLPHEAEDFFEFTAGHMLRTWGILAIFILAFTVLARIALSRIGKGTD